MYWIIAKSVDHTCIKVLPTVLAIYVSNFCWKFGCTCIVILPTVLAIHVSNFTKHFAIHVSNFHQKFSPTCIKILPIVLVIHVLKFYMYIQTSQYLYIAVFRHRCSHSLYYAGQSTVMLNDIDVGIVPLYMCTWCSSDLMQSVTTLAQPFYCACQSIAKPNELNPGYSQVY